MTVSTLDTSGWLRGLDKLVGPMRTKLARSMAVAGGTVLRDEAERWVPVGTAANGSITPGLLKSALYLAYKEGRSNDEQVTYSVSWNAKKAPHGHLQEFGHWQTYKVVQLPNGDWFTDVTEPLASPRFVEAKPFLRPAYHVARGKALQAMAERGRQRLPELLAGDE